MSSFSPRSAANARPVPDRVISDIADYVDGYKISSKLAFETAHYCLIDSLGCGFEALAYPDCVKLLGPIVPGTLVPNGARVPATSHVLDPVEASFNIGTLIRWLDFNDAFYGEMLVHPSDAFGGILAAADWASRTRVAQGKKPFTVHDVFEVAIKAYEIMGGLAFRNRFTERMGLDHVFLVKVACAAVVTKLLGGTRDEIINAVSNAWIDGHALTVYRRKPNSGPRKSWAAGDAAARGVWLALMALKGEMGYPSALTAKTWGFYDVLAGGKPFKFQRPYGSIRHRERAIQDCFSGGVPCANSGGGGDQTSSAGERSSRRRSRKSSCGRTVTDSAFSTRPGLCTISPTAITACSTSRRSV